MAYIIKSNVALNNPANSLGDVSGYMGTPDFRVMLDFASGKYTVDGVDQSINDVISVEQSLVRSYLDFLGRKHLSSPNTPRITYMPESNEMGLAIEGGLNNFLLGNSFTTANASEHLCVSWEGAGNVTLNATGTTLFATLKEFGRTFNFYTRTGVVTGTVSTTGDVSDVMVTNSNTTHLYKPYASGINPYDVVKLKGLAKAVATSSNATILCRFIIHESAAANKPYAFSISVSNGVNPAGGILGVINRNSTNTSSSQVKVMPDGAPLNGGAVIATVVGNTNKVNIGGVSWKNKGAEASVIASGQVSNGLASSKSITPPSQLNDVYLGSGNGVMSSSGFLGFTLTHCVIYDRQLSDEEVFNSAFFGD